MDLIVTDVKLQYGLMLWEQRYRIIEEVEKNGSAKLLVEKFQKNYELYDLGDDDILNAGPKIPS